MMCKRLRSIALRQVLPAAHRHSAKLTSDLRPAISRLHVAITVPLQATFLFSAMFWQRRRGQELADV
jgi:hypothetical protein